MEYHSILKFVDNNLNEDLHRNNNKDIINKSTMNNHNDVNNQKNGYHMRRQTFDASTEFENYQQLFDHETRELLQS